MISNTGLNCTPIRPKEIHSTNNSSLGFGNETAEKIRDIAELTENSVVEPVLQAGVIGVATGAAYKAGGNRLNKLFDAPITSVAKAVGDFVVKHITKEGFVGKTLRKSASLVEYTARHGTETAVKISNLVKGRIGLGVKLFTGLVAAVEVGRKMPEIKQETGRMFEGLEHIVTSDLA